MVLGVAFAPKDDSLIEGQSPGGWHLRSWTCGAELECVFDDQPWIFISMGRTVGRLKEEDGKGSTF